MDNFNNEIDLSNYYVLNQKGARKYNTLRNIELKLEVIDAILWTIYGVLSFAISIILIGNLHNGGNFSGVATSIFIALFVIFQVYISIKRIIEYNKQKSHAISTERLDEDRIKILSSVYFFSLIISVVLWATVFAVIFQVTSTGVYLKINITIIVFCVFLIISSIALLSIRFKVLNLHKQDKYWMRKW